MTAAIERLAAEIAQRYRIEREIGAGGMATVHLAHDVRHGRDVAIKVLHADLAAALGADRFLAEVRTTAKLQHPHILPLLDSGEAGDSLFYVMPLVTGESLRHRLERERQLPIDSALRIAREVASALDYAHRHGVVHRDVKPENILLHDGSALVADFGIALAVQSAGGQRMTQTGLSLGTPQYMSPEQAMGERAIDARSDVYSLAAVTYEMLTGEPPFTGATVQAVVAKVISAEPQTISLTRRNVPPVVAAAVRRGLEKLPADRQETAANFAAELVAANPTGVATADSLSGSVAPRVSARRLVPWAAAAIVGAAAFLAGKAMSAPADTDAREPIVATLLPEDGEEWAGSGVHFAMSSDGRNVAVVSRRGSVTSLVIRSLDSLGGRWLPQTEGAYYPFWSPDGRTVGYFANNQLKTIDLSTGAVRALCPAPRPGGGSWGADDVILYLPERGVGLHRASPSGGDCAKLPIVTPSPALDGKPRFLGDGRHFVTTTDLEAWLGSVDGDSLTSLTKLRRGRAVVAGPDYLLFHPADAETGAIFAQRIDVRARALIGERVLLFDDVPRPGGNTALAASNSGVLVTRLDRGGDGRLVARVVADGTITDSVPLNDIARVFGPHRLSRDGKKLALGGWEIAVLDLTRRVTTVMAKSALGRTMQYPAWAPDDSRIAFIESDSGRSRILAINTSTSVVDTLFTDAPRGRYMQLTDWSADGRYLAFQYAAGGGSPWGEAWLYDFTTDSIHRMFEEQAHVHGIVFSPTGGMVAYNTGFPSTSSNEVFIRPFPGPGTPTRVSTSGGTEPRWSRNGSELFYYDDQRGLMSVSVSATGASVSTPRVVVALSSLRAVAPTFSGTFLYDPAPDGRGFIGSVVRPRPVNLTVVVNWPALLARRQQP